MKESGTRGRRRTRSEARNEETRRRWEEGKKVDRKRKRGMRRQGNGDERTTDEETKGRTDERPSGQEKGRCETMGTRYELTRDEEGVRRVILAIYIINFNYNLFNIIYLLNITLGFPRIVFCSLVFFFIVVVVKFSYAVF